MIKTGRPHGYRRMACPVCMEDSCKAMRTLVCGHCFCNTCVKQWYMKGNTTCPMCRQNMHFRGMSRVRDAWDEERLEQQYQDVFNEALENILVEDDGYIDFMMFELREMEERFRVLRDVMDPEDLEEYVNNPFLEFTTYRDHYRYEDPVSHLERLQASVQKAPPRGRGLSRRRAIKQAGTQESGASLIQLLAGQLELICIY